MHSQHCWIGWTMVALSLYFILNSNVSKCSSTYVGEKMDPPRWCKFFFTLNWNDQLPIITTPSSTIVNTSNSKWAKQCPCQVHNIFCYVDTSSQMKIFANISWHQQIDYSVLFNGSPGRALQKFHSTIAVLSTSSSNTTWNENFTIVLQQFCIYLQPSSSSFPVIVLGTICAVERK